MPANLTAKYHKAEEEYRRASTLEEELSGLQAMLREIPKHKGTDKLQADLKQRISRARKQSEQPSKPGGSGGGGLRIPRQGAGRVVLIGGPNAGKSQLLRSLTRATPDVAPYPFTTQQASPGMMAFEDVTLQLIDTPPITADAFDPATQGLIRGADLVMLLVDLGCDDGIEGVQAVIDKLRTTKTRLARHSYLDEGDVGLSYTQTFLVLNKMDDPEAEDRRELLCEICPLDYVEYRVSAATGLGLDELCLKIFQALDVVRVYTKMPNRKEPDYDKPFTIRRGGTLSDIAQLIHKELADNLKFARVWGSNVQGGTSVKSDYVLHDKDVVEIHV